MPSGQKVAVIGECIVLSVFGSVIKMIYLLDDVVGLVAPIRCLSIQCCPLSYPRPLNKAMCNT